MKKYPLKHFDNHLRRSPEREYETQICGRKNQNQQKPSLEYTDCKRKHVPARSLKPSCQGNFRFKCKDIDLERRKSIFQKYWGLGDINAQRPFIAKDPKYRRIRGDKFRELNRP